MNAVRRSSRGSIGGGITEQKSTKATALALYTDIVNVGKKIEKSKKRITWRVQTGESQEHEISLTHSLASGKKVLRVDGVIIYSTKMLSFGDWDYMFRVKGGHMMHCMIKPCMDLNDMYDLIVDGVSYRRLPDKYDKHGALSSNPGRPSPYADRSNSRSGNIVSHGDFDRGYNATCEVVQSPNYDAPSNESRRKKSWTCPNCTLINMKPLAPVCEACGEMKPSEEALEEVSIREKQRRTRKDKKPSIENTPVKENEDVFNPFEEEISEAVPVANIVDDSFPADQFEYPSSNMQSQADPFNDFSGSRNCDQVNCSPSNVQSDVDPFNNFCGSKKTSPATNAVDFGTVPNFSMNVQSDRKEETTAGISEMLSGVDFSHAPSSSVEESVTDVLPETKVDAEESNPSNDLWSSNLFDLNLTEKDKSKQKSKYAPSLEQSRLMSPKNSQNSLINNSPFSQEHMDTPYQNVPQMHIPMVNGMNYATSPMQNMNNFNTVNSGYNNFNPPAAPYQTQQYNNNKNDPFAGLS